MNKGVALSGILSLALLVSMILAPIVFAFPPPINRPMGFFEATIEGGSPETVDYSWAYDTVSGEIIFNTMDTLIMFNGEHTDQYLPSIATSWTSTPLGPEGTGIDSGLPVSGLNFESSNQTGPNAIYYYRYDFKIRSGVLFQPPYNYSLTPADVAYSFQRTMVQDRSAGPQWMLEEPLLDFNGGTFDSLGDLSDPAIVAEIGALIRDSVQYNATDVWFNLMFPGAYAPFLQILCQTWSSIMSKQWINNQVITGAGRPDWNGDWTNASKWIDYHNPTISPLDTPTPMEYGSGPFIFTTLDRTNNYWAAIRHEAYWRGWPADFPALANAVPAGYVNTIEVTWAFTWADRKTMLLRGDVDFCAVPRQYLADMYQSPTPPFGPPNYPQNGIRCIYPLPGLDVNAVFLTFDIDPSTPYGPIGPAGVFNQSYIPRDFFGNATWGLHVRQAFAEAFDYASYVSTVFSGEAATPATAIIPGLPYYDPTVMGYSYDLLKANASLNAVPGLSTTGFTITLAYYAGSSSARRVPCDLLKTAIESLNPRYHCNVVGISWVSYLYAAIDHKLPCFMGGWLADFPDPHDFALPFYHTGGAFSTWQVYSNATMDALIDAAINTPDGPARAALYKQIQQGAVDDCPSFVTDQSIGRHFERDWVVGWYYNAVYSGIYFYNLWKYYYIPEAFLDSPAQPQGFNLPADVNYDGKVDIKDISYVAKAFGASYGPPINPRWAYRGDINNDRKIDIKDISYVAKLFGKFATTWAPVGDQSGELIPISPGANLHVSPMLGVELNFTQVTAAGYATAYATLTVPVPLNNSVGPYYDTSVTAVFPDNVTVSLAFDGSGMNETQKSSLQMMQYVDTTWIGITTYVDTANNVIYGETTHFSLIGIH
jgi:peptide/nickel transport system substrate-binding protein